MINASQKMWAKIMGWGMCLLFTVIAVRLVDIQVVNADRFQQVAHTNTVKDFYYPARRGDIKDSQGRILATSVPVKTVCADPSILGCLDPQTSEDVVRRLGPLLGISKKDLAQKLTPVLRTNAQGQILLNSKKQPITNSYVVLARKYPLEKWNLVVKEMATLSTQTLARVQAEHKAAKQKMKGGELVGYRALATGVIMGEDDYLRVYPNTNLAAHVLGCTLGGEMKVGKSVMPYIYGTNGVEYTIDASLKGVPGWRRTETDREGREVVVLREHNVDPRPGLNAVLTIDARIQDIVESALAEAFQQHTPISASSIVVRVRTGEILAMATLPNFNPNKPSGDRRHPDNTWMEALRNRTITDLAEPGSTFKIVVITAALNEKLVSLDKVYHCEYGRFNYMGKVLRDHERYGPLSVLNIITKSSNIGAAKVGIDLGQEKLHEYICRFGFGERTGIPLVGERMGTVHPVKNWDKLSISRIPMGHEVTVTPLQMVMAMNTLANKGRLMKPILIDRLEDENGNVMMKEQPKVVRQVCSEATAMMMVKALKSVVATNGTAPRARMANYTVGGKTGTAQKADAKGYLPGKYFSSFIGFFPADNPEICISVVMDEPRHGYYGGQVSAPTFKIIAERVANYLAIPPDIFPEPDTDIITARSRVRNPEPEATATD